MLTAADATLRDADLGLSRTPFGLRDLGIAGGLGLLAALLRYINWKQAVLMFNDGPRFLVQAQRFAAGEWESALGDPYHPLYALVTAAVRLAAGIENAGPLEWERAAVAVSIFCGAASVVVFYVFAKSAFGATAAWIGAALLACNPYSIEFSSDVQSEGLFQLGFLLAVALGWSALKRGSPALAGWAGFAAAVAYLIRPEGLGVAVAIAGVGAWQWLRGRWPLATAVPWALALLIGLSMAMTPYLVWLRVEQGEWLISNKKSVAALAGTVRDLEQRPSLGVAPGAEIAMSQDVRAIRYHWRQKARDAALMARDKARIEGKKVKEKPTGVRRWLGAVGKLLDTLVSAVRPEIVIFGLLGIVMARGRPGLRGQYVLAVMAVYAALLLGLTLAYGYISRRHVLTPGLMLLGYVGLAMPVAGRALLVGLGRLRGRRVAPAPRAAAGVAVALLLALGLSKALRPPGSHNRGEREAAEWIAALDDPGGPVAAGKRRVAYYAGAAWFPLRKIPKEAPLAEALRLSGVRYVVADDGDVRSYRDLAEAERAGLRVVFRAQVDDDGATVFEVGSREGG
jgi:4-amino-4-deoxy-L-arabinose transferase-like glycosyltransferase